MATIDEVKFKDLMELKLISEFTLKRIVSMRKLVTANSGCEHSVACSKQLEFMGMIAYIQEKLKAISSQLRQLILNHVLRMMRDKSFN